MSNLKIEDDHHVSRYCKPSSIGEDGLPLTSAFRLRTKEEYLSVNWLEYYANLKVLRLVRLCLDVGSTTFCVETIDFGCTKFILSYKIHL